MNESRNEARADLPVEAADTPASNESESKSERLQKLIARAGIASRRAAEELIAAGKVTVNGEVIKEQGFKADPATDKITVEGKPLFFSDNALVVVLLHKPRGCVTTKSDPEKRPTVFDALPRKLQKLHTIGRLDFDTAGVLLLTDDGELTHLLTHPSHGVEKIYHARVRGEVLPATLKKLENGIWIKSGDEESEVVKTLPCRAKLLAQTARNALVEIALREGRNRQVRKMLEAVGHPVSSLRRVSFAGVELEGLPPGAHRVLLPGEVHEIKKRAARQLERAGRARTKAEKSGATHASASPLSPDKPKSSRKPSDQKPRGNKPSGPKPRTQKPSGKNALPIGERIRREWK